MAHEIAKLLLEHAGTFLQRTEAIRTAISLGMPLNEIEAYLDWLDSIRPARPPADDDNLPPADSGETSSRPSDA
jgi:DNA-binding transcriptional MerR regulator